MNLIHRTNRLLKRFGLAGTVLVYAAIGAIWIIALVYLLRFAVAYPLLERQLDWVKGFLFVASASGFLYALIKGWFELWDSAETRDGEVTASQRTGQFLLFIVLAMLVPIIAVTFFSIQIPKTEGEAFNNLQAIAKLKTEQIGNWLEERQGDCLTLAQSKQLAADVAAFIRQKEDAHLGQEILDRLGQLRMAYAYESVQLLDESGRLLLNSGEDIKISPVVNRLVTEAMTHQQILHSDLYRDEAGHAHMDWIVPVVSADAQSGAAVAVIVLRAALEKLLFPLIQTWPTMSASAEALLVRRQGDSILYLNDLRHRPGSHLILSLPLHSPNLIAARAVLATEPGIIQGLDYRGVPSLAAYRPVSGTDWHIIAKIDRDEVLAPIWHTLYWICLVAFAATAAIMWSLVLLWRQQKRLQGLQLLAEKAKADRLLRSFFDMPFIGMAITSTETKRWVQINDSLCDILGYTREELTEKTWAEMTHPDDLETNIALFQRVLRGETEGFAMEKRFIRKDGTEVFTTIDAKCVRKPDGKAEYLVVTIEDITGRKRSEHALSLQARRAEALLELPKAAEHLDEVTFMQRGLELAEDLTGSLISYIHFVNDDAESIELAAWSPRTLEQYCHAIYDSHYPISKAGIWADSLHQNQPVIFNDYAAYPDKRGLPEGHSELKRLISVPVIESGTVVMLAGVGNKPTDYGDMDVETVQLIANAIWRIVRHKRAELALIDSEARFRAAIEASPVPQGLFDDEGHISYLNQAFAENTGYTLEDLPSLADWWPLAYPEPQYRQRMFAEWQRRWESSMLHRQAFVPMEANVMCKDGSVRIFMISAASLREGYAGTHLVIFYDVTKRKTAEAKIQRLAALYAALHECGIAIAHCTGEAELFLQICRDVVDLGGMAMAWIALADAGNQQLKPVASYGGGTDYLEGLRISLDAQDPYGRGPTGTAFREDRPFWCQDFQRDPATAPWHERGAQFGWRASAALPLHRNGTPIGVFTLYSGECNAFDESVQHLLLEMAKGISYALDRYSNETERRIAEKRIHHLANFDALTGLPNRARLEEHFKYALSLARRSNECLALMFLDIDRFKDINDTFGHSVGDALLIELSSRLRKTMREEDTVSRLGGDEFILLLPRTDAHGAALVARKLLDVIAEPYKIQHYDLSQTASIGIAIYPNDGLDMETLSKNADTAMYRAKQEGRRGYRFFTQEMQARSVRNMLLVNALRTAMEHNQLQVHYQPQVAAQDGRVIGAEALLRWQHPELGMISPAEFIPVAEESGMILSIGEWVLRHTVWQAKTWIDQGIPPLTMAVNLSAVQFLHADLPALVTRILDEGGLPPEYLELELTEGVAMNSPEAAIAVMDNLHERGVRLSIDDFGTGYSSLSYLKKFKVYKLKIDQSFVRDISTDPEDRAIVGTIIQMAKRLGLKTIAEGVETAEQLAFLREQECDELQGYYFSRPLPAEQFEAFVRSEMP